MWSTLLDLLPTSSTSASFNQTRDTAFFGSATIVNLILRLRSSLDSTLKQASKLKQA